MVEAYFDNIQQKILDKLDSAREEILVAMYWFTNRQLFEKLCEKVKLVKAVHLIVHNDFINNRAAGLKFQEFINLWIISSHLGHLYQGVWAR